MRAKESCATPHLEILYLQSNFLSPTCTKSEGIRPPYTGRESTDVDPKLVTVQNMQDAPNGQSSNLTTNRVKKSMQKMGQSADKSQEASAN